MHDVLQRLAVVGMCLPLGGSFHLRPGGARPLLAPPPAGGGGHATRRPRLLAAPILAACLDRNTPPAAAPPVDTASLPACTVRLFDAATQTHVYLIGSIHVRACADCPARCGRCVCVCGVCYTVRCRARARRPPAAHVVRCG